MALPDDVLSTTPVQSALVPPDSRERDDPREDFERGGAALNDPTQGLDVRDWRVATDGESVWVMPYPENSPQTLVFTGSGITEVSLAFDQNMRPTVAYKEAGLAKLRWFDTLINDVTTTTYPGARTPMVTLDDKRSIASATNDIILAYIREGNAYFRQQRDRFGVEYLLGAAPGAAAKLVQLGMGRNNRLQFKIKYPPAANYTDLLADTLFVVSGEQVVGVEKGAVREATWRSKTYTLNEQPAPAWGRVEGDYPIRVRVYGDGVVAYTTPPITSPAPFRLPSERWREWALELVGTTRVVEVTVANSREEL